VLAGNAAGDAETDAECAADGVGFHSVYDGSSDPCQAARLPFVTGWRLPLNGVGSKVEKSCAATRAPARADRRSRRYL
jgi:hypothetical protein